MFAYHQNKEHLALYYVNNHYQKQIQDLAILNAMDLFYRHLAAEDQGYHHNAVRPR